MLDSVLRTCRSSDYSQSKRLVVIGDSEVKVWNGSKEHASREKLSLFCFIYRHCYPLIYSVKKHNLVQQCPPLVPEVDQKAQRLLPL
jgi:hypothetical protein